MSLPPGATEVRRIGGGDINDAFHVVLADGREAFVKTRADASSGEFAAEAAGLEWLAEPGAVRTPGVLAIGDDYLALQWVEHGRLDAAGASELGRGLARTHLAGAPHFGEFRGGGAGAESGFGSLRLPNDRTEDWPTFYGERRLLPLARMARERGALTSAGVGAVERVSARLVDLVGPPEPPSRLHGDLWQGNVMGGSDGQAWLIDPSSYGGHREIDLAMLRLFGAPGSGVFGAYEEVAPLSEGWQERVGLYQLLPLLVHALLFGGSYRDSAEQMARRYAG